MYHDEEEDLNITTYEEEKTLRQVNSQFDLNYLIQMVVDQTINSEVADLMIAYWRGKLNNPEDPVYDQFLDYYLFHASINRGLVYAFLFDPHKGKILHDSGVSPDTNITETLTNAPSVESIEDVPVYLEQLRFRLFLEKVEHNQKSYFIGVIPLDTANHAALDLVMNIYQIYLDIYGGSHDLRFNNLYEKLVESMQRDINKNLKPEFPILFLHLKFDRFHKYINFAGDYFGYDMIAKIREELKKMTSGEAMIYPIKPHEYVLLFIDTEQEEVEPLFGQNMQIKNLLLNYRLRFYATSKAKLDMKNIWTKITKGI